jgi:hypothetical protein
MKSSVNELVALFTRYFSKGFAMKKVFALASLLFVFGPCLAQDALTISNDNSSLTVTRDPAIYNIGIPSDPLRLPRKLEWVVDGRSIVVYPSGPWGFIDVDHFHTNLHVQGAQIHAQGPMLGYSTSDSNGTVTGGAVYSVDGGTSGSVVSRIVEKVDIHNKTGAALSLSLTGMGFRPTQASLQQPDYTGLDVSGTTTVFFQGNANTYSITESSPFPPSSVLPVVSFSGFNPLFNQSYSLPAGGVLTMITELKVKPRPIFVSICDRFPDLCRRPIAP